MANAGKRILKKEEIEEVKRLYREEHMDAYDISERLGYNRTTVHRILNDSVGKRMERKEQWRYKDVI